MILRPLVLAFCVASIPFAHGQGLAVNSKKAPQNRADLIAIQDALTEALPKTRAATVCIDLDEGTGSGVIISPDGLVLTAAHVSTGVGKDLTVVMEDGTKYKAISLGLMAETDAAMVQITDEGPFPFIEVDRADRTKLGDWVFSLGHSGGFDIDRGVVVRLARLVRVANTTIQTDGTLIGGDSGGPLFDLEGRLIGIHSRVGQQTQVNMHVPIRVFINTWDRMLASEFIGQGPFAQQPKKGSGFLGVATEDTDTGLQITKIGDDSPAQEAGLQEGDIIRSINGNALENREMMQDLLKEMAAGDKLTLEITRNGEEQQIELRLGKR